MEVVIFFFLMKSADLIEALNDVGHVDPGCTVLIHLVEQVVPEQLQHVAVTRLRPLHVQVVPEKYKLTMLQRILPQILR